ncbi:ABC transporter substrate-binding protein [Paraburkholderia sp. Ac-20340]|uniref:ABC transporter substrate-binding protein n=1 Tax=Paraburkholderia sp. Ac-20340 TaxID=2703888 RepID=UPI0019803A43|nr:ABC transporter substrate-binding protein [Paraburkholderia sp. Ac-20340]MBN3856566.1 ABC transporter substrate-binding protein [Paraburkholderia sp. Ac-20340]
MKKLTRPLIAALRAALLAAPLAIATMPAHAAGNWCSQGKPVHFAGVTWESGNFTSEVLRYIVKNGYGCQTDTVPGSTAATETALSRNDLQVWSEQWTGRSEIIAGAVKAGSVKLVGDTLPGGTKEGWYVPDYVIHGDPKRGIKPSAPGLQSVSDLPKYKDLFTDDEEPDHGRFLNCPSGWDCERVNTRLLKLLKLDDSYTNFRPGTGAALDAAISSAYARGKPILTYYWEPAALMAKYKFVQLKMPPFNEACWKTLRDAGSTQPCASSYLVSQLKIGVSTPFYQAEPDVMAFFQKVNFPIDFLNNTILDMTEHKVDAQAEALKFLKTHPEMWKTWVPADVATKVQKSLGA